MLALMADHHIRAEITEGLRRRGIDVLTALEDGSATLDDEQLLARSTLHRRVLVTQDRDFLRIVADWRRAGREHSGVALAAWQDTDLGGTIEWLELMARLVSLDEMRSRVEFIPARR